jgi:hypothetical protein
MEYTSPVEDVYIPLKPLLTVSRIFGITPFSFTIIHKGEGLLINFEFLDIILVCMWTLGYFILGYYSVYELMNSSLHLPGKMIILLIIKVISTHFTSIVTLITSTSLNRRKLPCMLYKLINVDQMVGHRNITNTYRRTRLETVTQTVVLVLSQIFIYSINYYTQYDDTVISVIQILFDSLGITFNILMTILYTDLIRTLKFRYKNIIEDLEEYFKVKGIAMSTNFKANYRTSSSKIFYYKELPFFSITRRNLLSELSETQKIRTLRFVYIELYDSVMLLNSYFGIPILFEIMLVMVTSVSALYGGFYFLRIGNNYFKTRILGYYLIFFGILFLTTFAWLIICCHAVTEEAHRGVISIQRITAYSNVKCETALELDKH